MKYIIVTSLNYRETPPEMEVATKPSVTQPDEVLSIKEMMSRHVRGLPLHAGSGGQPLYYPEEYGYIPHPNELDLVERKDMAQHYAGIVNHIRKQQATEGQDVAQPPTVVDQQHQDSQQAVPSGGQSAQNTPTGE